MVNVFKCIYRCQYSWLKINNDYLLYYHIIIIYLFEHLLLLHIYWLEPIKLRIRGKDNGWMDASSLVQHDTVASVASELV